MDNHISSGYNAFLNNQKSQNSPVTIGIPCWPSLRQASLGFTNSADMLTIVIPSIIISILYSFTIVVYPLTVSNSSIDSLGFTLSISLFDAINGYNYGILSSKGWNISTLQQYRDIHGTYTRCYST